MTTLEAIDRLIEARIRDEAMAICASENEIWEEAPEEYRKRWMKEAALRAHRHQIAAHQQEQSQ